MRRPVTRRPVLVGALVVAALILAWALARQVDPGGEGESGTGLTYRDEFYLLSGAEVLPDRLGAVLEEEMAFQDTTAQLRAITGVDEGTAVAALLDPPGSSGEPGPRWMLLSPEPDLAADPWSDAALSEVVAPQP